MMSISVMAVSFDARDAAQQGPHLLFHKVPEDKTVKNRVHFDLQATDVVADAERLTNLGAKQIRSLAESGNRWIGFIDPDGNEFDLMAS
jgi:predicted enzyme related to lactoylglutathione lyase